MPGLQPSRLRPGPAVTSARSRCAGAAAGSRRLPRCCGRSRTAALRSPPHRASHRIAPTSPLRLPGQPGGLAGPAAGCGAGDAAAPPMVSRRRSPPHHVPAGPERMFEGCRRARSLWGGVRLEVAGESSPVVLHSFTQLDPDLPPLEVRAGFGGR